MYTLDQWKELIRDRETEILCVCGCGRDAIDVHHIDFNHKNNDPSNLEPLNKYCHNIVHNISMEVTDLRLLTRQFYSYQKMRLAMANRVRAYQSYDLEIPHAVQSLDIMNNFEAELKRLVEQAVIGLPIYDQWLSKIKGIGPMLSAGLISELVRPDKCPTVSSLWAYSGYHVKDGKAPRRKKGEAANWNPRLRMLGYKIGQQFIRTTRGDGCFGRKLYDEYRAYYEMRGDEKGAHSMARRRVVKDFLRCFWLEWREVEGFPLTVPHPSTTIFPIDWIEK